MTSSLPRSDHGPSPVQFSRLSRRGILLGRSLPQLIALSIGLLTVIVTLYTAGSGGLVWTLPVWGGATAVAAVPVGGRKAVEWMPVVSVWAWRTVHGQLRYRRRIDRPRPAGTLALPGDAAALREWLDPTSGAVLVHDPHAQTLTAIVAVSHPAFALLDPGEQQRRVAAWGRVLATTCRSGRIARVQVTERTLPESGTGLTDWWEKHAHDDGSWAALTYRDLIGRAGPAGERHATTISLALNLRTAARPIRAGGGGMTGAAAILRQEMTTLVAALRSADLVVGNWLSAQDLALVLRSAFDPAVDTRAGRPSDVGTRLESAGPVIVRESWDRLRTDSAFHAVLWISEWPRTQVFPGFLSPLVLSNRVLRTISLHYMPVRVDQAARSLRRRKTELLSDAHQRRRMGQIEDAVSTAEYDDVLQQEADLTAGHGVLRATGLMSVTAETSEELDAAVAVIEQAAIQASCETRCLVGQQAQAFLAAALPLCRSV